VTKKKKKKEKSAYVHIANADKECDLLHDRPTILSGKTPHN